MYYRAFQTGGQDLLMIIKSIQWLTTGMFINDVNGKDPNAFHAQK